MPDIEKVIKGVERCMNTVCQECFNCPYYDKQGDENLCMREKLMPDILELLKEQQKLIDEIMQRMMNNGAFD